MPKLFTIELPDELEHKLTLESKKLDLSLSDLVLQTLTQAAQNFDADDEPKAVILASLRRSRRDFQAGQRQSVAELWESEDDLQPESTHRVQPPPLIQVEFSAEFQRRVQSLTERYPHLQTDLQPVLNQLQAGRFMGERAAGAGHTIFRVQMSNHDIPAGKRAGYRLVYQMQSSTHLLLLLLYSKSGFDDLAIEHLHATLVQSEDFDRPA